MLVYIIPVGNMPMHLYQGYVAMLQASAVVPMSSLSRPGGYSSELSPFRSLSWESSRSIVYRFEETSKASSIACEDVHASNRPLAIIGLCHCPTTGDLRQTYAHFERSAARYPTAIVHKCFAFEHAFGAGTLEDVSTLDDLVMFPLAAPLSDGHTTVSLHLQVVLDAITVTILMSLESTVRSALRQHLQGTIDTASDAGFGLLNTQVEPSFASQESTGIHTTVSLHLPNNTVPTQIGRTASGNIMGSSSSIISGVTGLDKDARARKRMMYRQKKLVGDYTNLVGCYQDALDYYISAIDGLRDEEKRVSSTFGDTLWLAAALEGYVTALYMTMQEASSNGSLKFNVELVEKASEAISQYSRAHCHGLEARLIGCMGWYYVEVSSSSRIQEEAVWMRMLCLEAQNRMLESFSVALTSQQQQQQQQQHLEHLLDLARMSQSMGFTRKQSLYLHEAANVLFFRHRHTIPASTGLQAALLLAKFVATIQPTWLSLRFQALRQLIVTARKLHQADLVVQSALSILGVLSQCPVAIDEADAIITCSWNEPIGTTWSYQTVVNGAGGPTSTAVALHIKPSVYFSPPASIEKEMKKLPHINYFKGLPAALTAQASASTPRLLATPRQLMSAVMNPTTTFGGNGTVLMDPVTEENTPTKPSATADASSDVITASRGLRLDARNHISQWQQACWLLLMEDAKAKTSTNFSTDGLVVVRSLELTKDTSSEALQTLDNVKTILTRHGNASLSTSSSTFFYNPFQAKETKPKPTVSSLMFPLHEPIEWTLTLDNPLEISLTLPRIHIWLEGSQTGLAFAESVQLSPRQTNTTVRLGVRPTQIGRLVILGCLVHLKQQSLRYSLDKPIVLDIVPALPQLNLSVDNVPCSETCQAALSLFEHEDKNVSVQLRNASGVNAPHLLLEISLQRKGSHQSHSVSKVLVNSLELDEQSNSSAQSNPTELTIPGFTLVCTMDKDTGTMPSQSTLGLRLHLLATKQDVVSITFRAIYCDEPTHKRLYKQSKWTLDVTVQAGIAILAMTPLHDAIMADMFNPSALTTFQVVQHDSTIEVPPQSVVRMPLATTDLKWKTSSASGSIPCTLPESQTPWTIRMTLGNSDKKIVSLQRLQFYEICLHVEQKLSATMPPPLMVDIHVEEESPEGTMESSRDKAIVAGQCEPRFESSTIHSIQIMLVEHGHFQIHAVGRWNQQLEASTIESILKVQSL
ncbi:hypothetical protein LEN26_008519 [Aphanomyces euteiches]|nr:hypothetical protein AeMF1_011874 [Aphanomyces euteiches]KAH9130457.1 hypothetical protein LEN26_008519 [Aphanomyces euteiches]KAH9189520.1 hypothetical protein AeNC1_008497 [Aphanomyces euteiches]